MMPYSKVQKLSCDELSCVTQSAYSAAAFMTCDPVLKVVRDKFHTT